MNHNQFHQSILVCLSTARWHYVAISDRFKSNFIYVSHFEIKPLWFWLWYYTIMKNDSATKKRLVFNNKFGHVLQSFSGSSTTISIQWALLFADNWRACELCWIFNHTTYFYSLHKFFIEFRLLFAINYSPTASKQEVLWPIHLEWFLSRTLFLKLKIPMI